MVASLTGLNFFMPILSFLLVFIVVYAVLNKIQILGESKGIHLFVSFILAIFFVVNVSLVDFVKTSSSWFVVIFVLVFLVLVMIAFTQGSLEIVKNKYVALILVGGLIAVFVISSAYAFNWAVNWGEVWDWFYSDWFGFALLLVIAGIVSWVLAKS